MPTISLYVRDEDYEKWQAIERKSEWLHEKLNGLGFYSKGLPEKVRPLQPSIPLQTHPKSDKWSGPISRNKKKL